MSIVVQVPAPAGERWKASSRRPSRIRGRARQRDARAQVGAWIVRLGVGPGVVDVDRPEGRRRSCRRGRSSLAQVKRAVCERRRVPADRVGRTVSVPIASRCPDRRASARRPPASTPEAVRSGVFRGDGDRRADEAASAGESRRQSAPCCRPAGCRPSAGASSHRRPRWIDAEAGGPARRSQDPNRSRPRRPVEQFTLASVHRGERTRRGRHKTNCRASVDHSRS